jgi:hypothetical protein
MLPFLDLRVNDLLQLDDVRMFQHLQYVHLILNSFEDNLLYASCLALVKIDHFDCVDLVVAAVHTSIDLCKGASPQFFLNDVLIDLFLTVHD